LLKSGFCNTGFLKAATITLSRFWQRVQLQKVSTSKSQNPLKFFLTIFSTEPRPFFCQGCQIVNQEFTILVYFGRPWNGKVVYTLWPFDISWPFGKDCGHLVAFSHFGTLDQEKIWQPCFCSRLPNFTWNFIGHNQFSVCAGVYLRRTCDSFKKLTKVHHT
jgi:hypothetical protein